MSSRFSEEQEAQIREIVGDELATTDSDGNEVSVSWFERMGLSRREALKAIGLVALGYSASSAALKASTGPVRAQSSGSGTVGTEDDPLAGVHTESLTLGGETETEWPSGGAFSDDDDDGIYTLPDDASGIDVEQINNVVYLSSGDVLNDVVDDTSLPALFVLPEGTVTWDGSVGETESFAVVGRGKNISTVQNAGNSMLEFVSGDASSATHLWADLTVDGNSDTTDGGRVWGYGVDAEMGMLRLSNVEVRDIDLSDQSTQQGIINAASGNPIAIESIEVIDGCEFRLDSFSGIQPERYWCLRANSNASIDHIFVDDSTRVISDDFRQQDSDARSRGFQARVQKHAYIGGYYENVSNYCARATTETSDATAILAGTAAQPGEGDQWALRGQGTAVLSCEVLPTNDNDGDRGIIADGPMDIIFRDATVNATRVGVELRGYNSATGTLSLIDVGSTDDTDPRPAVQINDKDEEVGKTLLEVHIYNNNPDRYLDPAIELNDTSTYGWKDGTMVFKGLVEGYESNLIDDQTPSEVTVNTDNLVDDS
ncbi:hypothetical protein [Haloprofundus halobius]|uniref:hypothetical protein n=1 Tax=Haloprofundus halobius TaxID=2876194 RepID=UPI001CC92601|nr:hypothetical protein [Haloprofundus halobius]